ncbi:ankyrin-like protein [Colletotrichum kahawae]|uniref:Ankyrin-like protein n=1 Tax=Colletotrichum kahawae TaxID=34407 RepID=A0AAE0DEG2_COLKA|nr:ankyrin-like protein [Colletotrichum kahawae]
MSYQIPPSLSALPTELCYLIGDQPAIKSVDLASLARVNWRFYIIFTRYLRLAALRNRPNFTVQAARCGDLAGFEFAYERGAKLDVIHKLYLKGSQASILGTPQRKICWGTPLHFAVASGHINVVNWLLSKNVSIEAPGCLHCECFTEYDEVFDRKANKRVLVWTPLHYAICQGHTNVAHRLLNAGADVLCKVDPAPKRLHPGLRKIKRRYNDFFCDYTEALPRNDFRRKLLRTRAPRIEKKRYCLRGANHDVPAIHTAAAKDNRAIIRRLTHKMGVDIKNEAGSFGEYALYRSAHSTSVRVVRFLVALGKSDRIRTSVYPPLVIAFTFRHPALAVELMKHGAPVWEWYHKKMYWSLDLIRVPVALLTRLIDDWRRRDGYNERVGPEQIGLKRVAFLMAARETVETVPQQVSAECCLDILFEGFFQMCEDGDFDLESILEYIKITDLKISACRELPRRLTSLSLTINAATMALQVILRSCRRIYWKSHRTWNSSAPVVHFLLQNGAAVCSGLGFGEGDWGSDLPQRLNSNCDGLIEILRLLGRQGAYDDEVDWTRPNGLLHKYGYIVGYKTECSKNREIDLELREKIKNGTWSSLPRRARKILERFGPRSD